VSLSPSRRQLRAELYTPRLGVKTETPTWGGSYEHVKDAPPLQHRRLRRLVRRSQRHRLGRERVGQNEVKSKHIGKGQVKRSDIAKDAVNSAKVAQGSLLREDFAPDQLPAGPQGERGESATKLFAYIRDGGGEQKPVIEYGSGVTAVEEGLLETKGEYVVTFNRDLDYCVVNATSGMGRPQSLPATSGARVARRRSKQKGELSFCSSIQIRPLKTPPS
jgi:hypothetical protein